MISDTLHDAVSEIDKYLQEDIEAAARMGDENYGYLHKPMLDKILAVRDAMEDLRCELDIFPAVDANGRTIGPGQKPKPRPNPMDVSL